jgi:hypothetical protein
MWRLDGLSGLLHLGRCDAREEASAARRAETGSGQEATARAAPEAVDKLTKTPAPAHRKSFDVSL